MGIRSPFLLGLSMLLGTIIGAGVFGLPYVFSKSGMGIAVFYFIVIGAVMTLFHLCFGEVCLRTSAKHRLIGYAERYIGQWGTYVTIASTVVGTVGALLAYMILGGMFLKLTLGTLVPISEFSFSIAFWVIFSYVALRGIRAIAKAELLMSGLLFLSVLLLLALAAPHIQIANIPLFSLVPMSAANMFLPYGVVLFSLSGSAAIPEIAEFLKTRNEKKSLKKIILSAFLIILSLYALFTVIVIGVSGALTSPDALSGLGRVLGSGVVMIGAFFGLLATATSFLVLGDYLKNSLLEDIHLPSLLASAAAFGLPLAFFLLGLREFIRVIGLAGIVVGVVEGVVILILFHKAKQRGDRIPEFSVSAPIWLSVLIAVIFAGGGIAALIFT